jgi:predicted transcriptional regulator
MPTQKRRVSVTLEDDQATELDRLARLSGQSISSIVGELIGQALPVLQRMSDAMEAYVAADADKQRVMRAGLERAHADLIPEAEEIRRRTDAVWDFETYLEIGSTADPDDY